jgi:hypothetical protein
VKIDNMPIGPIVDPQTGEMSIAFRNWLEEAWFGASENAVGTVLSGLAAAQAQVAGIDEANAEAASEGLSSDFTVTVSPETVSTVGAGAQTSQAVTVNVSGGTAPYAIVWTKTGGVAVDTVTSPSSLGADGSFEATFTKTVAASGYTTSYYKVTVTDSAGSPLVSEKTVTLIFVDTSLGLTADDIGAA